MAAVGAFSRGGSVNPAKTSTEDEELQPFFLEEGGSVFDKAEDADKDGRQGKKKDKNKKNNKEGNTNVHVNANTSANANANANVSINKKNSR